MKMTKHTIIFMDKKTANKMNKNWIRSGFTLIESSNVSMILARCHCELYIVATVIPIWKKSSGIGVVAILLSLL